MRAEAGIKLAELDAATFADSRQELRLHPSTHKTGTLGGYVAGGSSGIGSITWGLLRDRGNILMTRVVTMEAEPRILELRGADIQKVNHAYGTNGVITELELPLAPAYRWAEILVALPDLATAARCADALAREDAILKKLVVRDRSPGRRDWLFPDRLAPDEHALILMVAEFALDALDDALAAWPARIARRRASSTRFRQRSSLCSSTPGTTRRCTRSSTTAPSPTCRRCSRRPATSTRWPQMAAEFGDEVPMHLEFVRFGGEIACFGLQLVRYTSDERLRAIIDAPQRSWLPDLQSARIHARRRRHEEGRPAQLAFKREADPLGLLNPGKMIGWDDPAYDESQDRQFLYGGD